MTSNKKFLWLFGVGLCLSVALFVYNNYSTQNLQGAMQDADEDNTADMLALPGTKTALAQDEFQTAINTDAVVLSRSPELSEVVNQLSSQEKQQWTTFEEVLVSKNDNDPRIDQSLRHMDASVRQAMIHKYGDLPQEKRNERGLIAFLISRDVKSPEDLDFLKGIYNEPPCRSLENCQSDPSSEDPHHSGLNHMTLNYPQMVPLYQLEAQIKQRPELLNDPVFKTKLRQLLDVASRFDVPAVQKKADELRARL